MLQILRKTENGTKGVLINNIFFDGVFFTRSVSIESKNYKVYEIISRYGLYEIHKALYEQKIRSIAFKEINELIGNIKTEFHIMVPKIDPVEFNKIGISRDKSAGNPIFTIFRSNLLRATNGSYELVYRINFDAYNWKLPYSIQEFKDNLYNHLILNMDLLEISRGENNLEIEHFNDINLFTPLIFEIRIKNMLKTDIPKKYFNRISKVIEPIIEKVNRILQDRSSIDYSTYFNFPKEIQAACNQYLMYFAQFLLDLGIKATAEIKNTPQGTLFTIVPENPDEALDNIKELLIEYLNAPSSDILMNEMSKSNDVSITQWQENILHLHRQLEHANTQIQWKESIIQSKDATITSLNLTNYQLSNLLEESKSNNKNTNSDEEAIISDFVTVSNVSYGGFKFNLAAIIRRLKRKK